MRAQQATDKAAIRNRFERPVLGDATCQIAERAAEQRFLPEEACAHDGHVLPLVFGLRLRYLRIARLSALSLRRRR